MELHQVCRRQRDGAAILTTVYGTTEPVKRQDPGVAGTQFPTWEKGDTNRQRRRREETHAADMPSEQEELTAVQKDDGLRAMASPTADRTWLLTILPHGREPRLLGGVADFRSGASST